MLDRYVREGLPGAVLLVRTSEGQWNGAAGYANLEAAEPMRPTHRHHAASVTKMYTAAAVLCMVEEGVIDLDDRIGDFLPEEVLGSVPNGEEASVRQLLGHTSGIPDFGGTLGYDLDFFNDPAGSYPPARLLSYLRGQKSIFAPGAGYFYANSNYVLLALVLDQLAEGGHAGVIERRILRPLGLGTTYYRNRNGLPAPPGLVNSYQDLAGDGRLMNVSDLAIQNLKTFFGNSGLIATSADFAAFLEGLLEGRVIGREMLAEMQRWGERSRYGLGLNFIETPFGPGIGHSGGDIGVLTQVRHFPESGATLVLLVNGGASGEISRLNRELWDEVMLAALGTDPSSNP